MGKHGRGGRHYKEKYDDEVYEATAATDLQEQSSAREAAEKAEEASRPAASSKDKDVPMECADESPEGKKEWNDLMEKRKELDDQLRSKAKRAKRSS